MHDVMGGSEIDHEHVELTQLFLEHHSGRKGSLGAISDDNISGLVRCELANDEADISRNDLG